jgi:hypothetical protein
MSTSKVNLIDPINTVSKFGSDYNGMPDYEKMSIFVELTVTRRGKTIIIASADGVKQDVDSTSVNINMLGFEQSNSSKFKNYHTTDWTNNVADDKTRYEGFGIQSINIAITPSAVPIVNIEFVDIKGMNFLNKGANSPYSILYDFPPPIYTLTVKGYYGKKLTYTLHLLEQNTRFDGTNGNYYISAKFTSRTFSPLTDILFNYIKTIPFMDSDTTIDFVDREGATPPPQNTYELIQNLKKRNSQITKLNNTSEELKTTKDAQLQLEKIKTTLSSIDSILQFASDTFSSLRRVIVYNSDYTEASQDKQDAIEILNNTSEYNAYIRENDISSDTKKRLILAIVNKETIDGNSNVNVEDEGQLNAKRNTLDEVVTNRLIENIREFKPLPSERKGLILNTYTTNVPDKKTINGTQTTTTSFVGIDITKYYITLFNEKNKLQKDYETAKEKYDKLVNDKTIEILGFEPTLNNVFRILANDCDRFFSKLIDVGGKSDTHHEKYRSQILTSTNSKNVGNIPIGAFPLCYKLTTTRSSEGSESNDRVDRAYPTEVQQFRQLPEPFPEVNFIEGFINASIELSKLDRFNSNKENTDVVGNNLWFPINPVDTTLKTSYSNESPYFQLERKKTYQLNEVYNIILNRYYILSQFTNGDFFSQNENYVKLVAKSEALNLAKTFIDKTLLGLLKESAKSHKSYNEFISWISNPKNGVNYYSTINGTTDFVKFDNSEISFYRSRDNDNFVGFDYVDDNLSIAERVVQENSDDIIDQFITKQNETWTKVTNFFTLSNPNVQKFSKENLIYFPDDYKTENAFDSKFIQGDTTVELWADYITDDSETLKKIFSETDPTYNTFQKVFFMVSNIGRTRSFFSVENEIVGKFSVGSVVQVPEFANLYMGALALAYHDDITRPSPTYYSDMINDLLSKLPATETSTISITPFYVRNNLINDQTFIKYLSKKDAEKFVNEFTTFVGADSNNLVNGEGTEYKKVLDSIISVINDTEIPEGDDDAEVKYKNALESSQFIKYINGNRYILNFSDITFKRRNKSQDLNAFVPISNLSGTALNRTTTYFNQFFSQLIDSISDRNTELDNIDKEIIGKLNDNDIKNQMYYSFKTIYDRWIPSPNMPIKKGTQISSNVNGGFPLTGRPLIDSFKFVDRAFNNIGGKVQLNIDSLIDMEKDFDLSVFQVMSRILSENGFEFFPIENFMIFDSGSKYKWEDAFKISETLDQPTEPSFVVMYIGGTSSSLDNEKSETADTGIKDLEKEPPVDFVNNNDGDDPFYANVNAFRVRFGQQNQSFFTDIQFDQKEFTETNESLSILASIADDQGNASPIPKGQNLFNTYSQRSYTAKVSGLGNAMIQPMQYFQIENIPMFNGAYIILKVDHQITPNHMTTSFEGMRLAKIPVPFVSNSFTSSDFNQQTSPDAAQQETTENGYAGTPNSVTNNGNLQVTKQSDGSPDNLNYPSPPVSNSMDNLFSTVATQPLKMDNT